MRPTCQQRTATGQKASLTSPSGTVIEYNYDANQNLANVSLPSGSYSFSDRQWNAPQKLSVPGGSVQTKAYDPLMRLTRIKVNNPSQSTLMDYQYTYDAESNITQKATEHGSYDYQYDDLYRLSTVSNPWGMSNEAWTYDALGNRKTDKQRGGSNEWQVNANNQLTKTYTENNSEVTPVFDENGSLIKHQTTDSAPELNQTYLYDAQNRLIEVRAKDNQSIAHYQYDPFGRRMVKTVKSTETNQENTTYFVYSDDGLIAEANANGAMTTEYGWQPVQTGNPWSTDPLFITTTRAGSTEPETFAYQNDHLGTPQKIIDSQGQIVWAAKATAFGETEVSANSTIINNLRFPGQYFDAETKTHYNYFRDYNPTTGTYRQEDPIGLNGGINVYGYVEGNSINDYDPYGLFGMDNVWSVVDQATGGWSPPQGLVDFSAGWGDMLSFGITAKARDMLDIGSVNKCSGAYRAGEAFGFANSLAVGWAAGLKSTAKAASTNNWSNFSHSLIPNRAMKRSRNPFVRWLNKRGNRLNGDYVSPEMHIRMDPIARGGVPQAWLVKYEKFGLGRQWINRLPYMPGAAIYGAGSAAINDCECN